MVITRTLRANFECRKCAIPNALYLHSGECRYSTFWMLQCSPLNVTWPDLNQSDYRTFLEAPFVHGHWFVHIRFQSKGSVSATGRREVRIWLCSKVRWGRKYTKFWKWQIALGLGSRHLTPNQWSWCHFFGKWILFIYKIINQFRFDDDVVESNDQSCCILSGPPCIRSYDRPHRRMS